RPDLLVRPVGERRADPEEPLEELAADAAERPSSARVTDPEERHPGRGHAADPPVLLDQERPGACPGGGDRRDGAGRAAAAHQHVDRPPRPHRGSPPPGGGRAAGIGASRSAPRRSPGRRHSSRSGEGPRRRSSPCTAATSTRRGSTPARAASAAATPAATPLAMAVPWFRVYTSAWWSTERQRPATSRPSIACGTRTRYGIS